MTWQASLTLGAATTAPASPIPAARVEKTRGEIAMPEGARTGGYRGCTPWGATRYLRFPALRLLPFCGVSSY